MNIPRKAAQGLEVKHNSSSMILHIFVDLNISTRMLMKTDLWVLLFFPAGLSGVEFFESILSLL